MSSCFTNTPTNPTKPNNKCHCNHCDPCHTVECHSVSNGNRFSHFFQQLCSTIKAKPKHAILRATYGHWNCDNNNDIRLEESSFLAFFCNHLSDQASSFVPDMKTFQHSSQHSHKVCGSNFLGSSIGHCLFVSILVIFNVAVYSSAQQTGGKKQCVVFIL